MFEKMALACEWCLDVLFPKECLGCRAEGEYVCQSCRGQLMPAYAEICFGCHKRVSGGEICDNCRPRYAFDGLIIAADYENELIGTLIKNCKYRFVRELSDEIAELIIKKLAQRLKIAETASTLLDREFFSAVIISAPLSKRREKWRGFNQAELIARRVAEYFSLSVSTDLKKIKHRRAQAKLNEAQRLINLKDCFVFKGTAPKLALLIDDVVTTGATLNECARVLKEAGAEEVWGVVAAKG